MRQLIVSKRTAKTFRPELALAPGPQVLAQPGAGTMQALYGSAWAFALYVDGPQLLQVQGGEWVERLDPEATAGLDGARHVSLAWDQAARPVLAFEIAGQVYVRQWQAGTGYVTRGPWAGRDPLLIADAVTGIPVSESDLQLLHLSGAALVVRTQRDNYAVPLLVGAVEPQAVLDQGAALWGSVVALGEGSAPFMFASDISIFTAQGAAALAPFPAGGELVGQVIVRGVPTESAGAGASPPEGGELIDLFASNTAATESASSPAPFPSGGELLDSNTQGISVIQLTGARAPVPDGGALARPLITQAVPTHQVGAAAPYPDGGTYQ